MVKKTYELICTRKLFFVIFLIGLTIISSINIFHSGIVYGDDINFHMHRIMGVVDNISILKNVPVYFNYLNGFGYANGLFYPDLFLFIPAIFNYFGLNIILSLKLFILIINFCALCSMFFCVYKITKTKKCAYLSVILYALSNYRLADFVCRGCLAEMISFVFIPIVILGLFYLFFDNFKKGYFLTIGLSCLCFCHVISFYLMCFFIVLFVFINIRCFKEKGRLRFFIFYIFLSGLITSHFWIPMLEQLQSNTFNIGTNSRIFQNVVPFYVLLFDFYDVVFEEWFPCGIGLFYYISIFKFYNVYKNDKFLFTIYSLGIISIMFCLFKILWKIDLVYRLFSFIQFPWRFYMFSTVFFVIGFSIAFKNIKFDLFIKVCLIYACLLFFANSLFSFLGPYIYAPLDNEVMFGEYLPMNFDFNLINNYSNDDIMFERNNNVLHVDVINDVDMVELPLIYYKGYGAKNRYLNVIKTENGLVGVLLKDNVNCFDIVYNGTDLYNITRYSSAFGFIILIYIVIKFH